MTDQWLPGPSPVEIELATVLAALADPVRLRTVQVLAEQGETACGAAADIAGLQLSKSTLSHHLKTLREAGVVRTRTVGKWRLMSLRRDDLDLRFPGLLDAVLEGSRENAATTA